MITDSHIYYYTIGESGMSHAYSFFVISWFIWALHYFIEKPNWKNSLQMGIAIGLAVLIRPTNILIAIFPFMLGLESMKEIGNRILFFMRQPYTYLSIVIAFLAWVPQLIYWKIQTGYFLYYSYSDETFKFLASPHIGDVLFGNVAGLFTYSPLLLLIIPGLFVMAKRKKLSTAIGISVIFLLIIYLNSSWWIPTFDCSFGHRAFIEYFPLFTIPIAFFFHAFFANIRAIIISAILILFFFVNIRIAYLYKKYPCWKAEWGYSWTWDNVAYIVRVAFYVDPPPSQHFRAIEKKESLPKI